MGITPELVRCGYAVRELREVDGRGRVRARMDPRVIAAETGGRFVSVARSDLSQVICATLEDRVEMIFGHTLVALADHGDGVTARFAGGASREFDLVVGADGLHSRVRELVFGPESRFERYLGIVVSMFELAGYEPRDELVAVTHTTVGAQALRFARRDGTTVVALSFRHDHDVPIDDVAAQQELLRSRFGRVGWEVPAMLERMAQARSFYLDRASQIRMPSWTRGRIALLGDAAACASLLAGQGSALAMTEAYVLARALAEHPTDHGAAFAAYETRLMPFLRSKQDAAVGMGVAFAPRNRTEVVLRNAAIGMMRVPWLARLVVGRSMRDAIEL